MSLAWYIALALIIFAIGAVTVIVRRSAIISLMGIEMMLNAANLAFIAFARIIGSVEGQVMAFVGRGVAAAEVVIGLALIVGIFKSRATTDVDDAVALRN